MSTHFTALFDANVLYPAPLRDCLLRVALTGLFRAKWSDDIHDEWMRNLAKNRPDLTNEKLQRTRQLMDTSVMDAKVTGYESLIDGLTLPDPGDRHVLAAAIVGRADVIVTFNGKDFPDAVLATYGLCAIHPDDFMADQLDLRPEVVCRAVAQQRASLKNPQHSVDEFLAKLLAQRLPMFVDRLQALRDWL